MSREVWRALVGRVVVAFAATAILGVSAVGAAAARPGPMDPSFRMTCYTTTGVNVPCAGV